MRAISRAKQENIRRGNLFVPLIFSFGAKLEDLPVDVFLNDPTKLSNSLRTIQNYFQVDGVVCYGDDTVLAEILGKMDPASLMSTPVPTSKKGFEELESRIAGIAEKGRVATALEVAKRLNILLPDTIIMGVVPGPVKLASQITGLSSGDLISEQDLLVQTTKATLTFARALGETGIDMLMVREDALPLIDSKSLRLLTRCYSPLWNTAKYYGFHAFLMPGELLTENVAPLKKIVDGIIFPAGTDPETWQKFKKISFSLPVSLLEKEQDEIESFLSEGGILDALNSSRLLLVTTDKEVPETIHKEYMIRGIRVVRDFLNKDLN